jgi:hypothetical protein
MAYTQAQINAALAVEIGNNPSLSQATLIEAGKSLGLSDAQINAAFDTIPGFNAQGQWDAADYIANRVPGTVDTQAQVDAANAARAIEQAANEKFSRENQIQHSVLDEATGQRVQLNPYHPDFNPNNPITLAALGQKVLSGDTAASNFFLLNPQYRPLADAAWAAEKARLNEIDRVNALTAGTQPTGLLTGQVDQGVNRGADAQGKAQKSASPSTVPKGFIESLTAIPNITDEKIVAAMKLAKVSPKNLADALGISEGEVAARVAATVSYGQSVTLGDTVIAPQYRVTGSGETQEIGAIENVYTSKVGSNGAPGTKQQQYAPTGEFLGTVTNQKVGSFFGGLVEAFSDPVVLTALLGGAAASGVFSGLGVGAGTTALGTGTGLTAGSSLSGLTAGSTLSGLTTGAGALTGANTLLGGAALGTTLGGLTTGVGAGALTAGATALTASQIADLTKAGLTATQIGSLLSGGATTAGGLLQQQTSREAAQKAQQMIEAETAAAKTAAQFRPVGMTTRFGTSEFKLDPVTGQLVSAGYTASPGVLEAQNRLVALGNQGLAQAEAAQGQFAPLQTGAQNLFSLGNQYIAKSPEAVAQNYLNQQMALLQPGRETELANLQNKLQQQGRGGLAVAQGGTLGATTPELQALYNARAQQEAQLAANAQQYGQQQVAFGAGLLGTGAQTMGQYYGGQQAAYAPYTTALGQFTNLEQLAQQPLTMGASLAQQSAQAGANMGQLGLRGAQLSTALATGQAATTNPYATVLSGLGSSSTLGQGLGGLLGGGLQSAFSQTGVGSSGFGSGLAYGNQDLGLFL